MTTTATATPRNRSLKYEDHTGLMKKFAKKYHARAAGAQLIGIDFGDIEGELALAFVKAAKGYDATSQWTFTAFLTACTQNHMNMVLKRLMREQFGTESASDLDEGMPTHKGLGYISLEQLRDEEGGDILEAIAGDSDASPEQVLCASQTFASVIGDSSLSPVTRIYIAQLANPGLLLTDDDKVMLLSKTDVICKEIHKRYGVRMGTLNV